MKADAQSCKTYNKLVQWMQKQIRCYDFFTRMLHRNIVINFVTCAVSPNKELGSYSAFKLGMSISVSVSNEKTSGPQEQSVKKMH